MNLKNTRKKLAICKKEQAENNETQVFGSCQNRERRKNENEQTTMHTLWHLVDIKHESRKRINIQMPTVQQEQGKSVSS